MMKSVVAFLLVGLLVLNCSQKETEEQLRAQAQLFEKEEKFEDALKNYEKQLADYPDGKFADEALHKVAFLYYNNFHEFNKSIDSHKSLVAKYPESKFVARARFMIGYIYANDLKDFDSAREAYKEFLEKHEDSELSESVKWELEHLGKDINEQLQNIFTSDDSNGKAKVK